MYKQIHGVTLGVVIGLIGVAAALARVWDATPLAMRDSAIGYGAILTALVFSTGLIVRAPRVAVGGMVLGFFSACMIASGVFWFLYASASASCSAD